MLLYLLIKCFELLEFLPHQILKFYLFLVLRQFLEVFFLREVVLVDISFMVKILLGVFQA